MTRYLPLLLILTVAGLAIGGTVVDQGQPGTQGAWKVTDQTCYGAAEKATSLNVWDGGGIGIDGGDLVPSSALAGRRLITVCNSPRNTGSGKATCRSDGLAPSTAVDSPGQVLDTADCVTYYLPAGAPVYCIADVASTVVTTTECR